MQLRKLKAILLLLPVRLVQLVLVRNVAGVQVTTSSASMGGSARIVLRGIGSINGENRPLIVVDGIPFNNANFNTGSTLNNSEQQPEVPEV
jgi:hypothetical protein